MRPRLSQYILYCTSFVLIGGALYLRIISYPVISADYVSSLSHWLDALRGSPGLEAFAKPFSDYPPLYLYALKGISYLPGFDLYWIKTLSVVFDVILALTAVAIVSKTLGSR
ncbi:MAG: hypothetical protein KGJ33_03340, partial [Patescibacteria group bacterium]|nr:hypothetical protein [Patescibacteria group bacterium]